MSKKSHKDQLIEILDEFEKEKGNLQGATTRDIAAWAYKNNKFKPGRQDIIGNFAKDLAKHMRSIRETDAQGRKVRKYYPAKMEQTTFWYYRNAQRHIMQIHVAQRRRQVVGDLQNLKTDVDSYNENYSMENPIQLELDFTMDILETEIARRAPKPNITSSPNAPLRPSWQYQSAPSE